MALTAAYIAAGIEEKAGYYACQNCRHARYFFFVQLCTHFGHSLLSTNGISFSEVIELLK